MRVRVITPPAPIVTWEEADAHLKLDGDVSQRALVERLVAAATSHIDGPAGWLGRALGPQTLEATANAFWPEGGRLPYPELIEVVSVEYRDPAGDLILMDPALYEISGSELLPVYGTSWPSARASRDAVRVRYLAGYVADPLAPMLVPAVPEAIRAAILLMVGDLYRNRETVAIGTIATSLPMSTTVENLLFPFRVFA